MKVWIVSFFLLFGLAELYQWAKDITLPLPVFILAGAFLAIASNYEKGICSFLGQESPDDLTNSLPQNNNFVNSLEGNNSYPQLSESSTSQAKRSISFKINRTRD
ncbi:hypothetical protein [Oscillatoria salina]|uniref:hypothetical protein n=1 Tax=Oscillatoria salina TaxID=331517 RepID=UPI0013B5D5CD|nr:hypothetical protein [Oscillatoria salina]MBZ8179390.1 hypothetical protein [Oscillatoria salina IIICB1]NET87871.1 hypothetical protein [Kamptonema sp. SIO1D9]